MASTAPGAGGAGGAPSVITENGSTARAAPRNCTAVTATGSRPRSRPPWATVNVADSSSDASTRPSPAAVAPPPRPPVTRPTPTSDTAEVPGPGHRAGHGPLPERRGDRDRHRHGADQQRRVNDAGPGDAAFLRTTTDPPYPSAPETRTRGVQAARTPRRQATASNTAAARPNRATLQPAWRQPLQGQLGQRHGGVPEQPGSGEGGDCVATVGVHTAMVAARWLVICLRALRRNDVSQDGC